MRYPMAVFLLALSLAPIAPVVQAQAKSPAAAPEPIPAPPDVAAPPADAQTTASGLAYKVIAPGTGTDHPAPGDVVEVHYTSWSADGTMVDSSVARGRSVVVPFAGVSPGWKEGLELMVKGEKRRLWVPEGLSSGKGAKGTLVYDVELIDILRVPPAPPDVAAPPADAERSKSGLAWKVLKPGTGTTNPRGSSKVLVHYTGWTTDGKMFDSSIKRGKPALFGVNEVIPGWTEGLKLMVEGESRRFWIPKNLAYRGQSGKPEGTLVFDVELVKITRE
ncbi:MAG TPA: FKBP-type peptidyl-prolyl cis-trans isomerase [Thermoanaerobaculia bacterium]|nr:FKBP-type peptidyl-prolyl cis-trans isomerase [Thermoanaerobaculia bacterium]